MKHGYGDVQVRMKIFHKYCRNAVVKWRFAQIHRTSVTYAQRQIVPKAWCVTENLCHEQLA